MSGDENPTTPARDGLLPTPPDPIDLVGLLKYVRETFNVLFHEVTDIRSLAVSNGERRTADIQRLIAAQVDPLRTQITTLSADLRAEIHQTTRDNQDVFAYVRHKMSDEALLTNRYRQRTLRVDRLMADFRTGLVGIGAAATYATLLQPRLVVPLWTDYLVYALAAFVCILWPLYKNLVLPLDAVNTAADSDADDDASTGPAGQHPHGHGGGR